MRGPGTFEMGRFITLFWPSLFDSQRNIASAGAGGRYADHLLTSSGPSRVLLSLPATAESCATRTRSSGSSMSTGRLTSTPVKKLPEIRSGEKSKLTGTDASSGWSARLS